VILQPVRKGTGVISIVGQKKKLVSVVATGDLKAQTSSSPRGKKDLRFLATILLPGGCIKRKKKPRKEEGEGRKKTYFTVLYRKEEWRRRWRSLRQKTLKKVLRPIPAEKEKKREGEGGTQFHLPNHNQIGERKGVVKDLRGQTVDVLRESSKKKKYQELYLRKGEAGHHDTVRKGPGECRREGGEERRGESSTVYGASCGSGEKKGLRAGVGVGRAGKGGN